MKAALSSFSFFLVEVKVLLDLLLEVEAEKDEVFDKLLEGFLVKVAPLGVKHAHEFPIGYACNDSMQVRIQYVNVNEVFMLLLGVWNCVLKKVYAYTCELQVDSYFNGNVQLKTFVLLATEGNKKKKKTIVMVSFHYYTIK